MKKLLVVELWGLGDLTLATTLLQPALDSYEVHLLGKPHAAALLRSSYPKLRFIEWDAPWTAFTRKYEIWKWPWIKIFSVIRTLRREKFDVAVSVRKDPRDHLLMLLAGARERIGFSTKYSRHLLNRTAFVPPVSRHRVEDWRELNNMLGFGRESFPRLSSSVGRTPADRGKNDRPLVVLHAGARISVRRWPEKYFAAIIQQMREQFSFDLTLVPDPDGYGTGLTSLADSVAPKLTIEELMALLRQANLLICNDSGPMHLAAAVGTPTLAFFGPTDSRVFGPWGVHHKIIARDLCVYRPCFDYCRFAENYCLTRLTPDEVWPEIRAHLVTLVDARLLPKAFLRTERSAIV